MACLAIWKQISRRGKLQRSSFLKHRIKNRGCFLQRWRYKFDTSRRRHDVYSQFTSLVITAPFVIRAVAASIPAAPFLLLLFTILRVCIITILVLAVPSWYITRRSAILTFTQLANTAFYLFLVIQWPDFQSILLFPVFPPSSDTLGRLRYFLFGPMLIIQVWKYSQLSKSISNASDI